MTRIFMIAVAVFVAHLVAPAVTGNFGIFGTATESAELGADGWGASGAAQLRNAGWGDSAIKESI